MERLQSSDSTVRWNMAVPAHPMLGKPMREAIGGGKSVIPSNVKVASAGATIDVPLSHKDDAWSFDHFDKITLARADAPRPEEIVVVLAFADGGRPFPRCGSGPISLSLGDHTGD